jgi:hypothetical protein
MIQIVELDEVCVIYHINTRAVFLYDLQSTRSRTIPVAVRGSALHRRASVCDILLNRFNWMSVVYDIPTARSRFSTVAVIGTVGLYTGQITTDFYEAYPCWEIIGVSNVYHRPINLIEDIEIKCVWAGLRTVRGDTVRVGCGVSPRSDQRAR